MKLTKKLIPAIGMLVLSAVMLATSSFAWFSMNSKVTATGMQVEAVAKQVFLQIDNNSESWTDEAHTTVVAANTTAALTPISVVNSATANAVVKYDGTVDSYTWVTAISDNPYDHEAGKSGYTVVAPAHGATVLKNTFKFRLNPEAGVDEAGQLKVDGITLTKPAEGAGLVANAISVFFVTITSGYECHQLWKQNSGTWACVAGSNATDKTTLTDGENITTENVVVEVYIFFDGEDENCTSNNATTAEYDISLAFSCGDAVTP